MNPTYKVYLLQSITPHFSLQPVYGLEDDEQLEFDELKEAEEWIQTHGKKNCQYTILPIYKRDQYMKLSAKSLLS